jgi:Outer membrane protein beta-barrel domain
MTEHESEQLYHNLRQKLEGYGSAPPETVWAGIRQQVPARRFRKRRLLPLLLLLGFFTTGGLLVGTRYWPDRPGSGDAARLTKPAPPSPARTTGSAAASISAKGNPLTAATSSEGNSPATLNTEAAGSAAAAIGRATAPVAGRVATGTPPPLMNPISRTRRPTLAENPATAAATSRRKRRATAGWLAGLATRRPARTNDLATLEGANSRNRLARAGQLPLTASPGDVTRSGAGRKRGRTGATRPVSNAPLALRVVRPEALEMEEPEVVHTKRRAARRPTRRELHLRNWSVQVAGGPAVTYRLLGSSATQLERLERPGIGLSGQLTGTYALSRQLAVSAGLGYSQYTNTLRYQLKKASSETAQQKDFRDVYQFVTIPVQAQLTLGRSIRWRYGLTGGGTLALLTGARTTEGSACNCGQRQWTQAMTDTVFSRTNLALTGGAFASYQVGIGQWITLRPQAQLFLNSLTAPSGSRTPRRPWGLGVQLGYSWDLDPRKR